MTQTVLLGDVADINSESVGKRYPHSKILYLDTSSVTENSFSELQRFNLSDAPSRAKRIVQDGDIVYSTVRPNLKHFGYIKNPAKNTVASTGFAVVRAKENIDSRYLYYWLAANERTEYLTAIADSQTSTFPAFNPSVLAELRVDLPDLETQKKIADVLGTIDEKIELNRQMNETLEQMGQALFRHYFIDNPEAERWGSVVLGDKIKPRRGKSLQSKNMKPGAVPVISGGLKPAGLHDESNTIAPVITISASGANAGFTALWDEDVWSADSSFIDTTITPHVYFYYLFLSRNQKRIYEMQTGSGQPHIYPSHLELLELPNAPELLIAEFNERVSANFKKIEENKKQVQTLTTLRDTLLPRLMNGKVTV